MLFLFNMHYWFLLLYSLLLDYLSVSLSSLTLYFIFLLMQAKQLTLVFYKFISKASAFVQIPASINKKHFVRILISDIANDEILDDLRGWDRKLLSWGNVESAHIYSDTRGDVAIIDDMDDGFVLESVRIFIFESLTIVEEQLMFNRNVKSCLYSSGNMF